MLLSLGVVSVASHAVPGLLDPWGGYGMVSHEAAFPLGFNAGESNNVWCLVWATPCGLV